MLIICSTYLLSWINNSWKRLVVEYFTSMWKCITEFSSTVEGLTENRGDFFFFVDLLEYNVLSGTIFRFSFKNKLFVLAFTMMSSPFSSPMRIRNCVFAFVWNSFGLYIFSNGSLFVAGISLWNRFFYILYTILYVLRANYLHLYINIKIVDGCNLRMDPWTQIFPRNISYKNLIFNFFFFFLNRVIVFFPITSSEKISVVIFPIFMKKREQFNILFIFFFLQLSYADTDPMFTSSNFPNFFRMVPSENAFNTPRVKLLQHFNWTIVGTIYQNEPRFSLVSY